MAYHEQALEISREVADEPGEAGDLCNLGICHADIGDQIEAVEFFQQALSITKRLALADREAEDLEALGWSCLTLSRLDEALSSYAAAFEIARRIGYRLAEAAAPEGMAEVHELMGHWEEAVGELKQAIDIADDIGHTGECRSTREKLALGNLHRNTLQAARELIESSRSFDDPSANHRTLMVSGVVALRQSDFAAARDSFGAALKEAERLIALCPKNYDALDTQGFSLCGLALCSDPARIPGAKGAFAAARAVTCDAGIVHQVLRLFDALAVADTQGIQAEIRPAVVGPTPVPPPVH